MLQNQLHVFTLSAESQATLEILAQYYLEFLEQHPDLEIASLCFTANTQRTQFYYRLAMVATSIEQFIKQLQCFLKGQPADGLFVGQSSSKPDQHKSFKDSLIDLGYGAEIELLEQNNPTQSLEYVIFSSGARQELKQQLVELWLQGASLSWESLYITDQVCVLSLPPYPIATEAISLSDHSNHLQQSREPSLYENQHPPKEYHLCEDIELVEPKNETERTIVQIWKNLFNLKSIRTDQNFFALGGDSMLALQLVEELEQTFDTELSLSTVFEAPTIQQLAQQVEDCNSSSFYSLVPLQPNGSKPRLFAVHLLEYRALSKYLGPDQPIYGLRYGMAAKTNQDMLELPKRIEELAAHYIEELRAFQPEGPYWLMGFSLGGRVALEMAQQLRATGQTIELLVIFDTFLSVQYQNNSLQQQISAALELSPAQALHRFQLMLRRSARTAPVIAEQAYAPHRPHPNGEAHFFEPYLPRPYPGKITYFQASNYRSINGVFCRLAPPSLLWREIALGGLEVYEIPGNHVEILQEPNVQILAQQLQALIAQNLQVAI